MRRAAAAGLLALLLAGCGAPSADLFVVTRSGTGTNANLTLLVSDDGSVTCNGHKHAITGKQLLQARALNRDLAKQAELNLQLPPAPGSVLSYNVRSGAGTVAFADNSPHLPRVFGQLQAFTNDISGQVCRLLRG